MRSEEQIRRVRDNSFRAIEMSRAAGLADTDPDLAAVIQAVDTFSWVLEEESPA
jgi:hypothetical protein